MGTGVLAFPVWGLRILGLGLGFSRFGVWGCRGEGSGRIFRLGITLTYQNLQKSRVPINSILGFIIRTYKKVGFGRLR